MTSWCKCLKYEGVSCVYFFKFILNFSVQCSKRIFSIYAKGCLMRFAFAICFFKQILSVTLLPKHRLCSHVGLPIVCITFTLFSKSPPGLIWSRYSLVIIPKNWNLFAVNFFVGSAGASQLYRIWR